MSILRNESTPEGKKIWEAVDNAAAKAPNWLREKIENAPLNIKKGEKIKMFEELVKSERDRQDIKWGVQRHQWCEWSTILGEEYGEVAKACLELRFNYPKASLQKIEEELVQTAAVCKAIWEHIQEVK